MTHNDVLHQIRYALSLNDEQMAEIFALGGGEVSAEQIGALTGRRDAESTEMCTHEQLRQFLQGLIISRRGPSKNDAPLLKSPVTHNEILKKLRVAFDLKEAGVREVFASVDVELSKGALGALFRKKGHKNYRACSDAMMGKFLRGITLRMQKLAPESPEIVTPPSADA